MATADFYVRGQGKALRICADTSKCQALTSTVKGL